MKNRQELAEYFAKMNFRVGLEVGVCNGYYSKTLCEKNPLAFIMGVDNWSENASSHRNRNISGEAYAKALRVLDEFIKKGQYRIIKKSSMDALEDIADESLDFVYIDAGHTYSEVKEDVEGWTKKVRKGGIVSGHDYYEFASGNGGIIKAVDEYVAKHNYKLETTPWDMDNLDRDSRQPSWYFIKE